MKIGNNYAFNNFKNDSTVIEGNMEYATIDGIAKKTGLLLLIALLTSLFLIGVMLRIGYMPVIIYAIAAISTVIFQLIIIFNPSKAKSLAIPYAVSEGLVVGSLCGLLQLALGDMGQSISMVALLTTISVFLGSLFLYAKGFIRVGRRFYGILLSAAIGILMFYLIAGIMSLISLFTGGYNFFSLIYMSGLGVVISIVMCLIAAMYVIFSFDNANYIVESNSSKDAEWYAAYAITLNVIYLFVEILRLVIILFARSRRD